SAMVWLNRSATSLNVECVMAIRTASTFSTGPRPSSPEGLDSETKTIPGPLPTWTRVISIGALLGMCFLDCRGPNAPGDVRFHHAEQCFAIKLQLDRKERA